MVFVEDATVLWDFYTLLAENFLASYVSLEAGFINIENVLWPLL